MKCIKCSSAIPFPTSPRGITCPSCKAEYDLAQDLGFFTYSVWIFVPKLRKPANIADFT